MKAFGENHCEMNLLPKEIIPTVLCYTLCSGHEDEVSDSHGKAEIAICNGNGYLLEFSNKKIINSCYVLIEDASKLQLFCNFKRGRCVVYYLVTNKNGVMVVVKKLNQYLVVVGCYNNVKDCKVFDFENKGRPQLGVYHFNSNNVQIMNFSDFDNYEPDMNNHIPEHKIKEWHEMKIKNVSQSDKDHLNELSETDDEIPPVNWNQNMFDFFSKKIQAVEQYNNELNFEIYKMDAILKNGIKNTCQMSDQSPNLEHIKFTNSWMRIHLGQWILGVEFWSSGVGNVEDIKIVLSGRDFTSYTYRFFDLSNGNPKAEKRTERGEVTGSIAVKDPETMDHSGKWECITAGVPEEGRTSFGYWTKSIAVVAFIVPDFGRRSNLSVSLSFICGTRQFHTEAFNLRTEHFFKENYQVFRGRNETSLSEDLLACMAVREETSLIVEMRYNLGISLEDVLTEKLGFSKLRILGDDYFLMKNGDLCGTSVFVKRVWNDLVSWHLRISATDAKILRILIGGIYNELPLPVTIRLQP